MYMFSIRLRSDIRNFNDFNNAEQYWRKDPKDRLLLNKLKNLYTEVSLTGNLHFLMNLIVFFWGRSCRID